MVSILIPTIKRDERLLEDLKFKLARQKAKAHAHRLEIVIDDAEHDTIGTKRNRLMERARGEYLCFFDSDDWPSDDYVDQLLKAADSGKDCASLKGIITFDGKNPAIFEHSIRYKEWKTTNNAIKYERYPNHLNLIRTSIARQFKFPEINHGEDQDWSTQIFKSELLKTEHYIPTVIYYYRYISKK